MSLNSLKWRPSTSGKEEYHFVASLHPTNLSATFLQGLQKEKGDPLQHKNQEVLYGGKLAPPQAAQIHFKALLSRS